jgi:hypothetical protein
MCKKKDFMLGIKKHMKTSIPSHDRKELMCQKGKSMSHAQNPIPHNFKGLQKYFLELKSLQTFKIIIVMIATKLTQR